jgi:hypothetical protein
MFLAGLLVLLPLAFADIRIDVVSYSPESQKARILVANADTQDYTDITFALDDMPPAEYKGSILKAGTAITIPKLVPVGKHTITITTREGAVFSKELLFAPSGKQLMQDAVRIKEGTQKENTSSALAAEVKTGSDTFYVVLVIAIFVVALAAFLYSRSNQTLSAIFSNAFMRLRSLRMRLAQRQRQRAIQRQMQRPLQRQVAQRPMQRPVYQQGQGRYYRGRYYQVPQGRVQRPGGQGVLPRGKR